MECLKKEDIKELDAICEKYFIYPPFSQDDQSLKDFYDTMALATYIGARIDVKDFEYVERLLEIKDNTSDEKLTY